ncbi:hypothetical protein PCANC_12704 [Puccinia coronata f. sp. avenae]|uniref:Uncharacterized protein n=1 Tax=Puccinia coronata f. sp. avenae TaxID=200324 RepID=A0A2N5SZW1_9BASI|nr:hypothetical protein PCANC_12704 [Puccinia coronata f. sp. avenae]PLW18790.1 hypothetical protein PCASD_20752 [Puccinia coronata f. sp. avenae]PLW49642.1 hypothetical protein PCASD_02205 [Puccinia coronata f. sp. avenae]
MGCRGQPQDASEAVLALSRICRAKKVGKPSSVLAAIGLSVHNTAYGQLADSLRPVLTSVRKTLSGRKRPEDTACQERRRTEPLWKGSTRRLEDRRKLSARRLQDIKMLSWQASGAHFPQRPPALNSA